MSLKNKIEALVIDHFVTQKNNQVSVIAKKYKISQHRVHSIINQYLEKKINNE